MEERNFIGDRLKLQDQGERVLASESFGPNRRKINNIVFVSGDGENGSVLWVAIALLVLRLNFWIYYHGTEYVFLLYMEWMPGLEVDKELGCVCLRWRSIDEEYHSDVSGIELNKKTELNVGEWFEVEPFSEIHGVVHVAQGIYGTPLLGRSLW